MSLFFNSGNTVPMGYFTDAREFCIESAVDGPRFTDYVMFGVLLVFSPIGAPLYYLGRTASRLS